MSELDVAELYDAYADFVWRSLHRMGVWNADLPDLLQEVFLVAHRRRKELKAGASIRGWLWAVALGQVRNYRRKAFRRREQPALVDVSRSQGDPEEALRAQRDRQRGQRLLNDLDPEKRAVFVMFEVEGLSGREIAERLELPLGTVHSRLHAARRELREALEAQDE